jgi:hypothetical protein
VLTWIEDEAVLERFAETLSRSAARLGNSFERREAAYFGVRSPTGRSLVVRDRGSISPRLPGLVATSDGCVLAEYDLVEGGWRMHRGSSEVLSDEEASEQILALAGM